MKRFKIELSVDFQRDLDSQLVWAVTSDRLARAELLISELAEVQAILERHPDAGQRFGLEGSPPQGGLRRLLLRKLPFVVWYESDHEREMVTLARLFHTSQHR